VLLIGCSEEEPLQLDPGVSPFYPSAAGSGARSLPSKTGVDRLGGEQRAGAARALDIASGASPGSTQETGLSTASGEVERQLRIAVSTAQKGDRSKAAELLDQVLARDPLNREALFGRAMLALDQARAAPSLTDRAAAVARATELAKALHRAYETLKKPELDLLGRALYGQVQVAVLQGRNDQAFKVLREATEYGFDAFSQVEHDDSMASLRSSAQFQQALKSFRESHFAQARERVKNLLDKPVNLPFDFALASPEGKRYSLGDFQGMVVVVDFWGTWCGPCRQAIPRLIQLYRQHHHRGLEIVGLDYEHDAASESDHREILKRAVKEMGIPYPCLIGDEATVKRIPNFQGFPTTVVVDRSGKVRLLITENNSGSLGLIADVVEVLLAEPAPKAPGPSGKPR
jgi:thiol-disulfide isomerase/thioredoxin